MAQKVIKIVGTSKESFSKAAANAIAEAAKTVRNLNWARVCGLEMELDGKNITQYRTMLWLRGISISIRQYLATRDPVTGTVYYVMLVVFALMPSWWAKRLAHDSGNLPAFLNR